MPPKAELAGWVLACIIYMPPSDRNTAVFHNYDIKSYVASWVLYCTAFPLQTHAAKIAEEKEHSIRLQEVLNMHNGLLE